MKKKILSMLILVLIGLFSLVSSQDVSSSCDGYNNCILYEGQVVIVNGMSVIINYISTDQVRLIVGDYPTTILNEGSIMKLRNGYTLDIKDIAHDSRKDYLSSVSFTLTDDNIKSYCDKNGECVLYEGQSVYLGDRKVFIDSITSSSVKLRIGDEFSDELIVKGSQNSNDFNIVIRSIDYNMSGLGKSRTSFKIDNPDKKDYGYYCSDSDNGLDYGVLGKTVLSTDTGNVVKEVWDSCLSDKLIEYYCENSRIEKKEISCEGSCSNGICVEGKKNNTATEEDLVKLLGKNETICEEGCPFSDKCYPEFYRLDGKYCLGLSGEFVVQKAFSQNCARSEECLSGLCGSGRCINEGLIQRLVKWFGNLFG